MTTKTNVVVNTVALSIGLTKAFLEGTGAKADLDIAQDALINAKAGVKDKQKQFDDKAKELQKAGVTIGKAGYAKGENGQKGFETRQTQDTARSCPNANAIAQYLYDLVDEDGEPFYTAQTVQTYLKILRNVVNNKEKFSFNPARQSGSSNSNGDVYFNARIKADKTKSEIVEDFIKSIDKLKEKADAENHCDMLDVLSYFTDALTLSQQDDKKKA